MFFAEEEVRRCVLEDVAIAQRWSEKRWEVFNGIVIGNPKIENRSHLASVAQALQTFQENKLPQLSYFEVMQVVNGN